MIAATQSNHPLGNISKAKDTPKPAEQACTRLRAAGLRVTRPRVAILEALAAKETPVSIEHLHREVSARSCDLVTVYRCLAAFEQLGLVRRSFLHNGTALYEMSLDDTRRYHIVCKACGRAERVDYFSVGEMERMLRDRGYADVSHLVEFFGICPTCQQGAASRLTQLEHTRG